MTRKRFSQEEKDRAVALYRQNGSTIITAKIIGCSRASAHTWTKHIRHEVNSQLERRLRNASQELRDKMAELFESGYSVPEIADSVCKSYGIVLLELRRRGYDLMSARNARSAKFSKRPEDRQNIVNLYLSNYSLAALARDYSCSIGAIQLAIKAEGVALRSSTGPRGISFEDINGRKFYMRSTWEAKVAHWLDLQEDHWNYEVEAFDIGEGSTYTPDFWIYDAEGSLKKLVDVKGYFWPRSKRSIKLFREQYPDLPFEVWEEKDLKVRNILALRPNIINTSTIAMRGVPQEELKRIVELYDDGNTAKKIGMILGLTEQCVMQRLRKLGKIRTSSETKRLKREQQSAQHGAKIRELRCSGLAIEKISDEVGITRYAVRREILCQGLDHVGRRRSKSYGRTTVVDSVTIRCESWK